jgi:hypothetical protein
MKVFFDSNLSAETNLPEETGPEAGAAFIVVGLVVIFLLVSDFFVTAMVNLLDFDFRFNFDLRPINCNPRAKLRKCLENPSCTFFSMLYETLWGVRGSRSGFPGVYGQRCR